MRADAFEPIRLPPHEWNRPEILQACRQRRPGPLLRAAHRYGISQTRVAALISGMDQGEVSRLVNNKGAKVTTLERWQRIADAFDMPDRVRLAVGLPPTHGSVVTTPDIPAEEPSAERASFPQRSGLGVTTAALTVFTGAEPGPSADPAQLESPLEIAERIQWASATNVDDMTLDLFDSMILDVIDQYERVGPSRLAPYVVRHRRQVHEIMRSQQHPRQRDRLYLIACRLSCILGALALDLGQWAQARAYAIESFHLAEMVDQADDLRAWVRATQSLIEYYACRYPDAVALARDGQRFARGGPHTIRLAVNGEARALARLGDHRGVDEAVDRALTRLADEPASPSVSSSLTVGAYCDARTAGNAATAYLSLGQPARAIEYATRALATFDAAGLRGPQALTRLDLATAVIRPPGTADPERAAALVHEALSVAQADQYQPVAQRAAEFLQSVEPWHDLPAVRDVEEAVRSRWDTARPALP